MTGDLHDVKDYFRAGFSTINKKNVFANVRDCIYFESLQAYVLDTMNEIQQMPNLKIANVGPVKKGNNKSNNQGEAQDVKRVVYRVTKTKILKYNN